jgi:hypothetical protein
MELFRRCGATRTVATTTLALGLLVPAVATPAQAAPPAPVKPPVGAPAHSKVTAPVTGSWTDPKTGETGTLSGTFTPRRFDVRRGQLVATGQLAGTILDSTGATIRTFRHEVTLPVQTATTATGSRTLAAPAAAAACDVLNLLLGPLDLNLLGLRVQLNQVDLDITAVPGAGNLLGNLLCAVTGLLDGAGALTQIAQLLNQILGILNGLGGLIAAGRPV